MRDQNLWGIKFFVVKTFKGVKIFENVKLFRVVKFFGFQNILGCQNFRSGKLFWGSYFLGGKL